MTWHPAQSTFSETVSKPLLMPALQKDFLNSGCQQPNMATTEISSQLVETGTPGGKLSGPASTSLGVHRALHREPSNIHPITSYPRYHLLSGGGGQ